MKFSKIPAIGISVLVMSLSGCDIDKPYERISGIDPSKPMPEELTLDMDNMSETSISFYWDGAKAVSGGALSFTIQLTETPDGAGDNYSNLAKTQMSTDDAGNINDACSFTKLTKGARYYVRVRANYAYSVYSQWEYLKRDGTVAQVSVGNGIVFPEFSAPSELKATALTYSSIRASWGLVGPASGYQVEYKLSNASEWTVAADSCDNTYFKIAKLQEQSVYDVRVRAFKSGQPREYTDYSTVTGCQTPVKPDFDPAIKTADDLSRFFSEIAAQSGESDIYTLENDIDMAGYDIVSAENFLGTFDGKGHKILNWTSIGTPLFIVNGGTVKNVILDKSCSLTPVPGTFGFIAATNSGTISGCVNNASISYDGELTSVTLFGAIAGRSTGLVENCTNNGSIYFHMSAGNASNNCIGGVVGQFERESGIVAVSGCINNGALTLITDATPKNTYVGGVVGSSTLNAKGKGGSNLKDYGIVKACVNTGAVTHSWSVNNSGSYSNVGGVAGYIEGGIEDCTNKGEVKLSCNNGVAASSTRPSLGGVAGYVTVSAKNCVNEGHVVSAGVFAAGTEGNLGAGGCEQPLFGGCFGGIGALNKLESEGSLVSCTNKGKVDLTVYQKMAGGTQSCFGGVAGYVTVPVIDCHNTAELNVGLWHKVARVGGVLGWTYCSSIKDCTNTGALTFDCNSAETVTANGDAKASYQDYVGGIIGVCCIKNCEILNCINSGKLSYSGGLTTDVLNYIGGIFGSYDGAKTLTACKNTGMIDIDSPEALEVGGLCGAFNGVMTDCENSGEISVKKAVGITGKEPEIGGLVGYANASLVNSASKGNVTLEAGGPAYLGGLAGGFGAADNQWDGCTVDCTLTTGATVASILGRFRSAGTNTVYYRNFTICEGLSSLAKLGAANGNSLVEGTKPEPAQ